MPLQLFTPVASKTPQKEAVLIFTAETPGSQEATYRRDEGVLVLLMGCVILRQALDLSILWFP